MTYIRPSDISASLDPNGTPVINWPSWGERTIDQTEEFIRHLKLALKRAKELEKKIK